MCRTALAATSLSSALLSSTVDFFLAGVDLWEAASASDDEDEEWPCLEER